MLADSNKQSQYHLWFYILNFPFPHRERQYYKLLFRGRETEASKYKKKFLTSDQLEREQNTCTPRPSHCISFCRDAAEDQTLREEEGQLSSCHTATGSRAQTALGRELLRAGLAIAQNPQRLEVPEVAL